MILYGTTVNNSVKSDEKGVAVYAESRKIAQPDGADSLQSRLIMALALKGINEEAHL